MSRHGRARPLNRSMRTWNLTPVARLKIALVVTIKEHDDVVGDWHVDFHPFISGGGGADPATGGFFMITNPDRRRCSHRRAAVICAMYSYALLTRLRP